MSFICPCSSGAAFVSPPFPICVLLIDSERIRASHLRAREQVHVPLLVPRGPLGQLRASENLHDVRHTERDETLLAVAVGVRPVETRLADGSLLQEHQGSSERLPATHDGGPRGD